MQTKTDTAIKTGKHEYLILFICFFHPVRKYYGKSYFKQGYLYIKSYETEVWPKVVQLSGTDHTTERTFIMKFKSSKMEGFTKI